MGACILIVEDDDTLRELLQYNLKREGYSVLTAEDGAEALEKYRSNKPLLIILDIMLPIMSGTEVCRIIRGESQIPIIMLTAKSEEVDRVLGLELGADDYITKPFSMRELLSRIKAVLRRSEAAKEAGTTAAGSSGILKAGDITVDLKKHEVNRSGTRVELNPKEFELLVLLLSNRGQVISREQILRKVWGYDYIGNDRTVDVHMRWMRRKLETAPDNPQYLLTVRGYGYKFAG
ncbi:MAG: response regulator transcription factor [Dehalococcoidia bacterium]|nr:response regulator transcription factor [Dehalococcoidia bacterium]MDD5647830.1 response regulator transcription factor [Dehalococcoidia bacterium]